MVKICTVAFITVALFGAAYGYTKPRTGPMAPGLPAAYTWQLPDGFPKPKVPAENPMTAEKVELGRRLFHDPRLSADTTVSCASCHQPALAYTDGRASAMGIGGRVHPRSAMSLTNVAYNATLGWDDPGLTQLEVQVLIPMFNTQPPEMGITGHEEEVLERFRSDEAYLKLFRRAFTGEKNPVNIRNVTYALASFERTLISGNTAYDRWAYGGDTDALNPDERAGARLFFSRRLSCFRCHAGFNFSGPVDYEGAEIPSARFHNTGLYRENGHGAYPVPNTGLHRHSGFAEDMGKFRAPTLRNIALTSPYMHDGSIPTLEAVIDHYAVGGRAGHIGPGVQGTPTNAVKDPLVSGFTIESEKRGQLVAFLRALTDEAFVRRAVFQSRP